MNWRNIKLVFLRELRDQLRDRRTLFMVAVLPLFMYPLLGGTFFQLSQFLKQHTATVVLSGYDQLDGMPDLPALVDGDGFAADLFGSPAEARLLKVLETDAQTQDVQQLNKQLREGEVDAVVVFPSGFADQLRDARSQTQRLARGEPLDDSKSLRPPKAVVLFGPREASQVAHLRLRRVLDAWAQRIMQKNLADGDLPESLAAPVAIESQDISTEVERRANVWSKLLPFVVFIWALTGAFYPAVDLCAGEKERGTLETLLASPAQRSEIVWGKLLTVIVFSVATAILNLLSLGATGRMLMGSLESASAGSLGIGMPPMASLLWIVVALPPVAALFSALSIACASFAKSTKEGQYYFMPLFMLAMPLMMLPMSPGIQLNLGNSLTPLMGVVLLLRALIEGQYADALRYVLPVTAVTLVCCLLAVKWAVHQFNQESVLFREGERFSVGLWLRKLLREPLAAPTAGMAIACVGFVMLLKFFAEMVLAQAMPQLPPDWIIAASVLVSQACILAPPVLMAWLLVTRTGASLFGPRRPSLQSLLAAFALAVVAHPVGYYLTGVISHVFPISEELIQQTAGITQWITTASPWLLVLLMGVLPAVCEETCFRGFVLGGLRVSVPDRWAVLISAAAFGLAHSVVQQSLSAGVLGVLIGYLAVRWGSIWPGVVFHATYNSLMLLLTRYAGSISGSGEKTGWRSGLVLDDKGLVSGYHGVVVALAAVGLAVSLWLIERRRSRRATAAVAVQ